MALLVGCIIPLVVAEGWARSLSFNVELLDTPRLYRTVPHRFGTNSRGFHAEEALSTGAVAVFGDSMTWGLGTAEQSWPAVASASTDTRFVNYSVYGYDIRQQRATLAEVLPERPAAIVLASYWNDRVPTEVVQLGEPPRPVWGGA